MAAGEGRSSSNELSSAPNSDVEGPFDKWPSHPRPPMSTSSPQHHSPSTARGNSSIVNLSTANGEEKNASATAPATLHTTRQDPVPVKPQRKPRKKKDGTANTTPDTDVGKREKVPRKPRGSSSTAAPSFSSSRKRPKLESADARDANLSPSIIPATNLQSSKLIQPISLPLPPATEIKAGEAAKYAPNGFSMQNSSGRNHFPDSPQFQTTAINHQSPPFSHPPAVAAAPRSTAIYDPVRSVTIQRPAEPVSTSSLTSPPTQTPPRTTFRPSSSPSISSIIDPPTTGYSAGPSMGAQHASSIAKDTQSPAMAPAAGKHEPAAMELDAPSADQTALKKQSNKKSSSDAPTRGSSPKPPRAKEQPPPLPPGSGLLSSSLFGGDSGMDKNHHTGEKGPNIVLYVDLKDPNNKVINFARLAEEKYGFAALYPRQAAQKERLARVAAAGAALERSASGSKFGGTSAGESGDDDVSVDIDRDSDNDGDVAMSGLNGAQETANSGTDGPGPKKRRRRKVEEYDQDDPFVDDSELLWEAQAAASKDGFFVYCGPLVPEGEKPTVERADGTVKRGRGRGRGGGPGSRGGRGGGSQPVADGGSSTTAPTSTRGGGPGSRGGAVTRKPRVTKAERLLREQEKATREKMAPIAAKPSAYPA